MHVEVPSKTRGAVQQSIPTLGQDVQEVASQVAQVGAQVMQVDVPSNDRVPVQQSTPVVGQVRQPELSHVAQVPEQPKQSVVGEA